MKAMLNLETFLGDLKIELKDSKINVISNLNIEIGNMFEFNKSEDLKIPFIDVKKENI